MSERSFDRLNIQQGRDGLQAVIPCRVNGPVLRLRLLPSLLVISALAVTFGIVEMIISGHLGRAGWSGLALVALGLICGDLVVVFTGKTALTLTPQMLVIESREGFYKTKTEKFLTENLSDLHFVKWQPGTEVRNDWHQNEIQFEKNGLLRSFGAGISQVEADALIAAMMRIYRFPVRNSLSSLTPFHS